MSGAIKDAPTILNLEWTNQHGCGDGDLNCNIVLQYLCRPSGQKDPRREIRNGGTSDYYIAAIYDYLLLDMCDIQYKTVDDTGN